MSKAPIYLETDATLAYGRNGGFTLATIGIHAGGSTYAMTLQFFGKRGAVNASIDLTKDDATRLMRAIKTQLEAY